VGPEDAWAAAESAGLADDIRAMPMQMHTFVSEQTLSGGQLQKLMIARALATNPRILVFDEATSALDEVSQGHVSRNLESLAVTRIVIAHRLSTVRRADRILVLERGEIVQSGTFDELVAAEGPFRELVRRQLLEAPGAGAGAKP
jgi:ABC-type bacteriocin/lantibiotic exporter with double-glycine peptidase domain